MTIWSVSFDELCNCLHPFFSAFLLQLSYASNYHFLYVLEMGMNDYRIYSLELSFLVTIADSSSSRQGKEKTSDYIYLCRFHLFIFITCLLYF
ncbi:hypothetical protein Syun_004120 [Stephania yunnanensis]|uniref:Uncharacterized protein n=1 Tax=Stephania yunnanensis TaxID=152371 RepID=A0AAP0L3T5_9MAGN